MSTADCLFLLGVLVVLLTSALIAIYRYAREVEKRAETAEKKVRELEQRCEQLEARLARIRVVLGKD